MVTSLSEKNNRKAIEMRVKSMRESGFREIETVGEKEEEEEWKFS